jgi:GGDEF domain-containing protein
MAVRWGGEEFLLILAHRQSDDLSDLAESCACMFRSLNLPSKPLVLILQKRCK